MTYIPDARDYLQLVLGGPTGPVDCTAWMGARLVAAHSQGHVLLTGRQIRLHTDEPVPDPSSPGLNLGQVDLAIRRLTSPDIDLDTRIGIATSTAQRRVEAGEWMGLQVQRSVLVAHGLGGGSSFGGGHAITVHAGTDGVPVIGDSLVPYYQRTSWATVWAAAAALKLRSGIVGAGRAYATFTRDVRVDYRISIHPEPPAKRREYLTYEVSGNRITGTTLHTTRGLSATCTPPRLYARKGHPHRSLVHVTSGVLRGRYVAGGWAEEV